MSLRIATVDDIPELLGLAKEFWAVSPYKLMRFDSSKGIEFLKKTISGSPTEGIVILAVRDEKIIGFIVGVANEPVFSRSRIAMELGWFVRPAYRGTRDSILLIEAYEDWAKRVDCSHVQAACLGELTPNLGKFYLGRGYIRTEESFVKILKV